MFNSILFPIYIYMGSIFSISAVLSYRLHKENKLKNTYKLLKKKSRKNNICSNVSNGKYVIKVLPHIKLPFQGI